MRRNASHAAKNYCRLRKESGREDVAAGNQTSEKPKVHVASYNGEGALRLEANPNTQAEDLRRMSPKPAKPKPINRNVVGSGIKASSILTVNEPLLSW